MEFALEPLRANCLRASGETGLLTTGGRVMGALEQLTGEACWPLWSLPPTKLPGRLARIPHFTMGKSHFISPHNAVVSNYRCDQFDKSSLWIKTKAGWGLRNQLFLQPVRYMPLHRAGRAVETRNFQFRDAQKFPPTC